VADRAGCGLSWPVADRAGCGLSWPVADHTGRAQSWPTAGRAQSWATAWRAARGLATPPTGGGRARAPRFLTAAHVTAPKEHGHG
jgi:hypothetical protein